MAVTKAKVVRDLNWIRQKSPVKFKNFGKFFFHLMLLKVEDQEYIVDSLVNASKLSQPEDMIEIHSICRPYVELKENEKQYRFMVDHSFKCKFCNQIHTEEVNLYGGRFREVCEYCTDKAHDERMDQLQELPEDHD